MIQDFQNHKQFSLTSSLLRTEKYRRNMFFGGKKTKFTLEHIADDMHQYIGH